MSDPQEGAATDILMTASNALVGNGDNKEGEEGIENEEEDGERVGGGVQPIEKLPDAMQELLPKNEEEEEEAKEEEEKNDSQQVHEPQYYPNNRIDRQNKSSRAPRRSPRNTSKSNRAVETTAEDPEGLAEEFENGASVSNADSQTLAQTVVELENRRDNMVSSGKMKDSLKVQMAIENAKAAQRESCKRETQKQALKENQDKQQKVREELRRIQQNMNEAEEGLKKKNNEYIESMQSRHKDERSKLDKKWKNDKYVQRRYNRSSQQLRTLRLTQERLIRAKKFSESENIGQIADRLEKEETNRNYNLMLEDYSSSVKALEERQREELELAETVNSRKLDEFHTFVELKKRPYIKRLYNLKKEEEEIAASPDNVWNLKHRNDGDLVSSIVGPRSNNQTMNSTRKVRELDYNTLKLPQLPIHTGNTSAASNSRSRAKSHASTQRTEVSVRDNNEEDEHKENVGEEEENNEKNTEEEENNEEEANHEDNE